jgi:hypothetical protein
MRPILSHWYPRAQMVQLPATRRSKRRSINVRMVFVLLPLTLFLTTQVDFAEAQSALPPAPTPPLSCATQGLCQWTLESGSPAVLLAHVRTPGAYSICRTDSITSSALAAGSTVNVVVDGVLLVGTVPYVDRGGIQYRMTQYGLSPQSCVQVFGKSIAFYRTDSATANTDISGTFSTTPTHNATPSTYLWAIQSDTRQQFEPFSTTLLYKLPALQFSTICRGSDSANSTVSIGLIVDGYSLEIPIPVLEIPVPVPTQPPVFTNPPDTLMRVAGLLHIGSCLHVEAFSLALAIFAPQSPPIGANGTYTLVGP